MTMTLDPEIAAVLMAQAQTMADVTLPERGDAIGLRAMIDETLKMAFDALPDTPDVTMTPCTATATDGAAIPMRWYTHAGSRTGAAVVYIHGGGMICGSLDNYDRLVRHYVQLTGVPFLAVGYRLAPEFPGTTPAEDSFAGVRWLFDHAGELGVDHARIALMGDSGGGGVGAAAAILARDNGVRLARQILIYPMLDDRNTKPDPVLAPMAVWTYDNNYTGWKALLGDALGTPSVPPVAAPARLRDFAGLAPAYIEVGDLDIFRDESIVYAGKLLAAGISCELHVHPGAPHAHDWLNPNADISKRVVADRVRVIAAL
ncbi:alpha/beta hydrolase [Nonomuraea turcica]|uniref:alpha/beta hydrolase n=1 Tax=Nonomuraea sp. G32 TaxID=3067274 RepID=UPI00273CBD8D|nr:alpha/beta hydrolase [Nonomuraea sp. G32]MDP4502247.1 alpha/beta hydrolase [Nonomuraea sp. G32]